MGLRRLDLAVLLACAAAVLIVVSQDGASGDSITRAFRLSADVDILSVGELWCARAAMGGGMAAVLTGRLAAAAGPSRL